MFREECTKVQFSLAAEVDTIRAWWQKALTQVILILFNGVSA
jgi:aryl carrier-like protein